MLSVFSLQVYLQVLRWWQILKKLLTTLQVTLLSNDFSFPLDVELGALHPLVCGSKQAWTACQQNF